MQRSDANRRRVVRFVLDGNRPEEINKPKGENEMITMYVNVQYEKSKGIYAGGKYTYRTTLDLKPGDKVIAPTRMNERQKAIVTDVGLIPPSYPCKDINEYDPEAEEAVVND